MLSDKQMLSLLSRHFFSRKDTFSIVDLDVCVDNFSLDYRTEFYRTLHVLKLGRKIWLFSKDFNFFVKLNIVILVKMSISDSESATMNSSHISDDEYEVEQILKKQIRYGEVRHFLSIYRILLKLIHCFNIV